MIFLCLTVEQTNAKVQKNNCLDRNQENNVKVLNTKIIKKKMVGFRFNEGPEVVELLRRSCAHVQGREKWFY